MSAVATTSAHGQWASTTLTPVGIRQTAQCGVATLAAVGAAFGWAFGWATNDWFVGLPELIGHDGVHPTDAGHAYLAAKIAPLICRRLTTGI